MVALIVTIVVVLGLPKTVAAIIVRMNEILNAMVANKTSFPSPPIALAAAQAHLAALVSAEAATKTLAKGTKDVRNAALELVVEDAKQLHGYVQTLANASPKEASILAANAAMRLRNKGTRTTHDVHVTQKVSGTLHVTGRSVKGAKSHDWQISTDGGKTWSSLQSTTKASTTITGLSPATAVMVRHRVLTPTGPTDWSPIASAIVS